MVYIGTMSDKKAEQICIRVEAEVYKKLKDIALLERRSVGFLVRDLIDEYLKEKTQEEKKKPTQKKMA